MGTGLFSHIHLFSPELDLLQLLRENIHCRRRYFRVVMGNSPGVGHKEEDQGTERGNRASQQITCQKSKKNY